VGENVDPDEVECREMTGTEAEDARVDGCHEDMRILGAGWSLPH
jgi:hypothetical protein